MGSLNKKTFLEGLILAEGNRRGWNETATKIITDKLLHGISDTDTVTVGRAEWDENGDDLLSELDIGALRRSAPADPVGYTPPLSDWRPAGTGTEPIVATAAERSKVCTHAYLPGGKRNGQNWQVCRKCGHEQAGASSDE